MRAFVRRFARNRPAVAGLLILLGDRRHRPARTARSIPAARSSWSASRSSRPWRDYLFGTDQLGRDVTAEVLHGARTSLLIGLLATAIAVLVGATIGGLAGYYGGRVDALLMRFTEIFQTIPFFLFAILLVAVLTPVDRAT